MEMQGDKSVLAAARDYFHSLSPCRSRRATGCCPHRQAGAERPCVTNRNTGHYYVVRGLLRVTDFTAPLEATYTDGTTPEPALPVPGEPTTPLQNGCWTANPVSVRTDERTHQVGQHRYDFQPKVPDMHDLSDKALRLILAFDGFRQPADWPGGEAGITIGIGYDLGYVTVDQFESDWDELVPPSDLRRLRAAIGLRGIEARNLAPELADIRIVRSDAEAVFRRKTLPLARFKAKRAFPGMDRLPPEAQEALVCLVCSRGTSMAGDRRQEMRAIRTAVVLGDLREIALQIRCMKWLWFGQGLPGMLKRREAEAEMVESSIASAGCGWEGEDLPLARRHRVEMRRRAAPPAAGRIPDAFQLAGFRLSDGTQATESRTVCVS